MLIVCTAISSPRPFEQTVPPSISALGYSLSALAAVGQDAAEIPAPRGGISYTPGISSRHQFHVESSNKRSIVLNTKKYDSFIVCYLKIDFSWSKPVMSSGAQEALCLAGNLALGIGWQHRCSCTPLKSKRRLVTAF